MYSIRSLNRHLWGISKLAVYQVWRFKEVSNVGGSGLNIKKEHLFLLPFFHSIDYTKALTILFKNKTIKCIEKCISYVLLWLLAV